MTNLNHYSVHYTMHMVMENRNGRNPGKHFFFTVICWYKFCATWTSVHCIVRKKKTLPYWSELCFLCTNLWHAFSWMLCPGVQIEFSPYKEGKMRAACTSGVIRAAVSMGPLALGKWHFPTPHLPKGGTSHSWGKGTLLVAASAANSGIAGPFSW